jgi:transglutaminase-like putative cysteine protease
VVTSTRTLVEKTTVEVFGRIVPALRWTVAIDRYPGIESTEFTDDDGHTLRSETNMGGLQMVQMLADKELALRPIDAPELLVSTLVTPDKPVPENASRVTYVLSVPEGTMPDLPSTGAQKVERLDARRVRVTVLKGGITDATPPTGPDAGTDPSFMASTPMIKADDPVITKLAKEALENLPADAPAIDKAKRLRAFVQRFIDEKALSVGFASASEVARTRTGDCTEHGVLLAALLRASGIPARVVSGLIFADEFQGKKGIFGYHMWAQAWLAPENRAAPRWVDIDGTLRRGTGFDAGHIALGTSALSDAQPQNFMVTLAPLLGRLKIQVEDVQP